MYFGNWMFSWEVFIFAIRPFSLILVILTFAKFVEFLKRSMIRLGEAGISYFPVQRYA